MYPKDNLISYIMSVKKSKMDTSWKNLNASIASTSIIPAVVRIVIRALSSKNFSITISLYFLIKIDFNNMMEAV